MDNIQLWHQQQNSTYNSLKLSQGKVRSKIFLVSATKELIAIILI